MISGMTFFTPILNRGKEKKIKKMLDKKCFTGYNKEEVKEKEKK